MSLRFRNIDVSPEDPVEIWPTEAILTALERGGLGHWRRLTAAIYEDPWGPVARRVEEALDVSRPYGVGVLMSDVLAGARARAERAAGPGDGFIGPHQGATHVHTGPPGDASSLWCPRLRRDPGPGPTQSPTGAAL